MSDASDFSRRAPGPWRIHPVDDTVIVAADGSEVAAIDGDYNQPETWPIMEANAAFIIHAVNNIDRVTAERDALLADVECLKKAARLGLWLAEEAAPKAKHQAQSTKSEADIRHSNAMQECVTTIRTALSLAKGRADG